MVAIFSASISVLITTLPVEIICSSFRSSNEEATRSFTSIPQESSEETRFSSRPLKQEKDHHPLRDLRHMLSGRDQNLDTAFTSHDSFDKEAGTIHQNNSMFDPFAMTGNNAEQFRLDAPNTAYHYEIRSKYYPYDSSNGSFGVPDIAPLYVQGEDEDRLDWPPLSSNPDESSQYEGISMSGMLPVQHQGNSLSSGQEWWKDLDQVQMKILVERLRKGWSLKDPRSNPRYILKRAQHSLSREAAFQIIYGSKECARETARQNQRLKNRAPLWLKNFSDQERIALYRKYGYYHNISPWTARTQINEFDNFDELAEDLYDCEESLSREGKAYLLLDQTLYYPTIDDAEAYFLMQHAKQSKKFNWFDGMDEDSHQKVYKRIFRIVPSKLLKEKGYRIDEILKPEIAHGILKQNEGAQKEFLRLMTKLV